MTTATVFDTSRAACVGLPGEWWFPELDDTGLPVGGDNHAARAKSVCLGCPIRVGCLVQGLRNEKVGIWGGASMETARRHMARPLRAALHDPAVLPEVCGCRWCRKVAEHFAVLDGDLVRLRETADEFGVFVEVVSLVVDRNGPGATCGLRVTYARGHRCWACSWSTSLDGMQKPRRTA